MLRVTLKGEEPCISICAPFGTPRNKRRQLAARLDGRPCRCFDAEPLRQRPQDGLDTVRCVSVAQLDPNAFHASPPVEFLGRLRIALVGLVKHQSRMRVLLGRDFQVGRFSPAVLGVEVLEERHAPAAAGAGAQALADERSDRRILNRQEGPNLPQADSEAQADFIVRVHRRLYDGARVRPARSFAGTVKERGCRVLWEREAPW